MWSPEQNHGDSTKENASIMENSGHGKWYGPCTPNTASRSKSGSPRESPRLSLTLFAKTPRISFGKVKMGASKVKRVIIDNPSSIAQSIYLDKAPEEKGFTVLMPVERGESLQKCDGSYEPLPRCSDFTIPAMSELDLPILWKPETDGNVRETITLKLGDFNRLLIVLFGNAIDTSVKQKPKMKTLLPQNIKKGNLSYSQKRKISTTSGNILNHEKSPPKKVLQESNKGLPVAKNIQPVTNVCNVSAARLARPARKMTTEGKDKGKTTKRTFKTKVAAKGVAQSRLSLVKKTTNDSRNIPRHPLPFAAKNMYFDEKWIEKQERGFVQWLNYILTPPDELTTLVVPESSSIFVMDETDGNHERSQPLAPTKEVLSLRTYTARRKMARLRRCACLLYQSQPVAMVAKTIESEVEKNRLCIRPDKHFHQDLGIRETILNMLLSYNSLWLRIGIETVYGEILPLYSNNNISGLKRFLKTRFLANPDIAKEYRHSTVAEYYRPGYYEALKKFTLKKFLLLVLFLDKAKLTRLIDHDPCLFDKNAIFKCNRDLLLTFSRDYLKGEGDVTKHLSFLNYTVTHVQVPLDEMDYAVKNLAVDLRDGLRITRVIELLTQNWTLSSTLRVPAISRLQKIHNIEVALKALTERDVFADEKDIVNPRHIVDGHREKTLSFLWLIILHFQVNLVVNEKQLKDEIAFLKKYYRMTDPKKASREAWEEIDVYANSEKLGLLLEWCRAVCRLYGVKVENFTVSMSDGRVLCYLLHYYHPCLVREEDICKETTQTCNPYTAEDESGDDDSLITENWVSSHDKGYGGSTRLRELKENERKNYDLCRKKVQELGGVPSMLKFTDMSSTIPDEKVVVTFVSYLCARLLDLKDEGRAARIIQVTWRRYLKEKQTKELKKITNAAMVLQKYFRLFLEKKRQEVLASSTLVIQAFYRGYQVRRDMRRRHCAAAVIQTSYRSYKAMKEIQRNYVNLKQATLTMQALLRGKIARRYVIRIKAARVLQSYWRRYVARRHFLSVKNSSVILQSYVRTFLAKRSYIALKMASVVIQRRYRALKIGRDTRHRYTALKKAVTTIQARRRGILARKSVARLRAVILIQATSRMWQCRRKFTRTKKGIIKIQSLVRRNIERVRYDKCVSSARVIQTRWRAYQLGKDERNSYEHLKASAITIQAFWRSRVTRREFISTKNAAVLIQASIRGFFVRKQIEQWTKSCCTIQNYFRAYKLMKEVAEEYKRKKDATVKLQALYRGRVARNHYIKIKKALVSIQATTRGHLVRKRYLQTKAATKVLQTWYRALRAMRTQREVYVRTRDAIVTLQASLRGNLVRRQLRRMNMAATRIQSSYRRHAARTRYLHVRRSIEVIQTRYRAWSVARQTAENYKRLRHAVVVIQKYTRGHKVRKELKMMSAAAVSIQARYRGYRAEKNYTSLRKAALKFQDGYRSMRLARATREEYILKRTCAIRLQTEVRRFLCVRELQRKRAAVHVFESRWRALVVSRQARREYHRTRGTIITIQAFARGMKARTRVRKEKAAIKLQSFWRGSVQRRGYMEKRDAVVKVQSCYKMLRQKRIYAALKESVVYLQKLVRANQACRRQTMTYGIIRGAVITLQAAVRGHLARKQLQTMTKSAIKIQTSFRCFSVRRQYLEMRRGALIIQRRRRALVTSRHVHAEFQQLRHSVITLQSLFRGQVVRREFKDTCEKLVRAQAIVRGFLARSKYHRVRKATVMIQQQYRAYREGRTIYFWYNLQRGACITLQAHAKAWLIRRRYLNMKHAAQIIQVYYRATSVAKQQRQQYLQARSAVVTIQAFTRGWQTRRDLKRSRAATSIQSWWRMSVARQEYGEERRKVIVVQSLVRAWLCRNRYQTLQRAAVIVQRRFRADQLCMKERNVFLEMKGSCLLIQHSYRYYRQRLLVTNMLRSVSQLHAAAVVVQRRYRAKRLMERTQRSYFTTRGAIITLQAAIRGYQARVYVEKVRASIVIQSYYRGYRRRAEYGRLRKAAVKLQGLVRGKQALAKYQQLRGATVVLQRRERARAQGVLQRKIFLVQKASAVVIQSYVRGYQKRCRYQKMRNAAIRIQAFERGRQERRRYTTLSETAIVIQRRRRANVLGKLQRNQFLEQKSSSTIIQSWLRGNRERTRFTRLKNAVIKTQASARGKHARVAFKKLRCATVVLQRQVRARMMGISQRTLFLEQRRCAILIQSHVRGYQEKRHYQEQRHAITKIQACLKGHQQQKRYIAMKLAVVCIQKYYRAWLLCRDTLERYQQMKNAVVSLQSIYRGKCARRFVKSIRAAITIQTAFRRYTTRAWYLRMRDATVSIQAMQRMRKERQKYRYFRYFTMQIQRRVTANQMCRRERTKYQLLRNGVLQLQALCRGWQARERVRRIKAALVIQRQYRACLQGRCARVYFVRTRMAAIAVQSRYRGHVARERVKRERGARVIQAYVRGYQVRRAVEKMRKEKAARLFRFSASVYVSLMVIRLQRRYRRARAVAAAKARMDKLLILQRWWRAKMERLHFLRVKHLTCVVQRSWRVQLAIKNQAATKIQAMVRSFISKRTAEQRQTAIVTIQSFWRGHVIRKQCKSTKIRKARQRIQLANTKATEPMKLCNRTRSALDYLLKCKNLTTVLGALVNLEVASRLSKRCTEQLVADNALGVIFKVVRNTNRSLAHIELIKHAIAIFINVTNWPTTQTSVVEREPNSLDTLVELACIFCENPDIFPQTCHLLTTLCHNESIRQDLLKTGKAISKLKSAYTLTKRKHDLDVKRNQTKRFSISSYTTKKTKNSSSPLLAVTALVQVLGLVDM